MICPEKFSWKHPPPPEKQIITHYHAQLEQLWQPVTYIKEMAKFRWKYDEKYANLKI